MTKCYGVVLMLSLFVILLPGQVLAEGQMWGNDVLVHQANHIYGFGMDQGDKDTLYLVVADSSTTNVTDTTYIYRSTNNGNNWISRGTYTGGRRGKADIIATKGDLDAIYLFHIITQRLVCTRRSYDYTQSHFSTYISDLGENVSNFAVCHDLFPDYGLYVVYQTDQDSLIFKRSLNFDTTWTDRANLSETYPTRSKPSLAWSRGSHLVVAGKTADNKIYTIRNTNYGNSANWQDGQYPSVLGDCDNPVVAGSHAWSSDSAIFWVFYERYVSVVVPPRWILQYHWSKDACSTWSSMSALPDTSTGNRVLASLHVLEENNVSNLTLAYRYEIGLDPRQIRYVYKQDAQTSYSFASVPYTGVNDYEPDYAPPHRAYTIRGTDNSVGSAILYVDLTQQDLYFDASSFTGVEDEVGALPIRGFSLEQNYPNPFNSSTTIEYSLESDGRVEIAVYDILGEKVKTLFDGSKSRGNHSIIWDGTDDGGNLVASGTYFCMVKAGEKKGYRKMMLMK